MLLVSAVSRANQPARERLVRTPGVAAQVPLCRERGFPSVSRAVLGLHGAPGRLTGQRTCRRLAQIGLEPSCRTRVVTPRILGQAAQLEGSDRALVRRARSRPCREESLFRLSVLLGQARRVPEQKQIRARTVPTDVPKALFFGSGKRGSVVTRERQ